MVRSFDILFANNWNYKPFLQFWSARCIWQKWTTCPNTMARGPTQLHRLRAGPANIPLANSSAGMEQLESEGTCVTQNWLKNTLRRALF